MSRLKTKSLTAVLAAVAATAVMSIGASAASAAPAGFNIPANSSASVKLNGTITTGGVNCTFNNAGAKVINNAAGAGVLVLSPSEGTATTCANGKFLSINAVLAGEKNGSAFTLKHVGLNGPGTAPTFGGGQEAWWSRPFQVPWTNGSGATASKFTFINTYVGETSPMGSSVLFTGNLSATKADGSLLVLQ